jgi:hypothetical protein
MRLTTAQVQTLHTVTSNGRVKRRGERPGEVSFDAFPPDDNFEAHIYVLVYDEDGRWITSARIYEDGSLG